jgi:HD-GYP domain-containing protein (c-di-GMP phosphodiesterase class II)
MADQQSDSGNEARQSFLAKQLLLDTTKTAFQQLSGLLKNVVLYPASHPYLLSLAEKMMGTIDGLLVGRKEVAFYFVNGELFFETHAVPIDESTAILMEQFTSRDIGGIVFKPGITTGELINLAILMSKEPAKLAAEGGIIEAASRENISHIDFHRGLMLVDKKIDKTKEEAKRANELFLDAIETMKEIAQDVHLNKAISVRRMNMVVQAMVDNAHDNRDALMGLTNCKMSDEHTFAHLVNTSILAISLATFLSFEKTRISALGVAAMLHDIGKIRIPSEIINKPNHLTDEEWETVERHPIEGALIISDIPGVTKMAIVTAFEHHQHSGVHGYPQIDGPFQQHLFSQIVSLADAYEVLTATRVYYNVQMLPQQVIRILAKKRGSDFNAVLVKAFINMTGIFPIGTLLKLSSNEIGLVVHQTSDLMRPRVLLLTKFDGSEKESGEEISLLEMTSGKYERDVAGTINPNTANIDIKRYLE